MLVMTFACWAYAFAAVFTRARALCAGARRAAPPGCTNTSKPTDGFLNMGGYGLYVWGSYGVTLVAMLADWWFARRALKDSLEVQA
jgi:heme exporter protein CcmD